MFVFYFFEYIKNSYVNVNEKTIMERNFVFLQKKKLIWTIYISYLTVKNILNGH